jgi:signal transduction histidine kinase
VPLPSPFRLLTLLLGLGCVPVPAQEPPRVLTTALEIRSLSPAEADRGIPVRLRGVIVFVEGASALFLQDETSTAFFRLEQAPLPRVGDEIELTAKTRMGLYLPGVDYATYRILGRRALPPGIPVLYDDLHFSRYHYQRVSVEGIVRSILPLGTNRSVIRLAMGSRVIEVRIEAPPRTGPPLIDSRIRITGLAVGLINSPRRQLVQPYVHAESWDELEVVTAAPPASAVPAVSAEELLAFRIDGLGERRVRIDGVVAADFGQEGTFLRQGTNAFAVRFASPTPVAPGEIVTIAGFPSMERFSASVVDAELISRQAGLAPAPTVVPKLDELYAQSDSLQNGQYDGHLVSVNGTLRDSFKGPAGTTLLMQGAQRTVQVRVAEQFEAPTVGSVLRVAGICQVETNLMASGFRTYPGLVSLRPTAAAAIEVLRRPSWWTPRRLTAVLAALAGLTVVAGLWITLLRRQVRRQTEALRQRIALTAAQEERQRIAREFHDTLEQELAGVSLRLDGLATRVSDEKARTLVAASRNLVSRIQTETRDLISDLRDPAETAGDLIAALTNVAQRFRTESETEIRVDALTPIPALPAATVHDLRMIARESGSNALRHGRAACISIEVSATPTQLRLRVIDNGCGYDPAATPLGRRGHFGCAGIRERSRKIGAEVVWQSALQRGTTVEVTLPLAPAPDASGASVS